MYGGILCDAVVMMKESWRAWGGGHSSAGFVELQLPSPLAVLAIRADGS